MTLLKLASTSTIKEGTYIHLRNNLRIRITKITHQPVDHLNNQCSAPVNVLPKEDTDLILIQISTKNQQLFIQTSITYRQIPYLAVTKKVNNDCSKNS